MAEGIKDKVAIIGMGCTKFGELWDKSGPDLIIDAYIECMQDAGIELKDIDAAWYSTLYPMQGLSGIQLSQTLHLPYIPVTHVENLCASGTTTVTVKGKASTVADLAVGMVLTGKTELGVATALVATVPVVHVLGTITAINGNDITVQPITGAPVTFSVGAGTVIKLKGVLSNLAALLVGQKATVVTELGVATTLSAT